MKVDRSTLEELEILATSAGGPGVLDLTEGAATAGGRERLAELIGAPLAAAEEIRARQRSLAFLARDAARRRLRVDPSLVGAVRAYRGMRFVTLSRSGLVAGRLEALWTGLRYPDLLRAVREGSRRSGELVDWLDEVCVHLLSRDPPSGLRRTLETVVEALGEPPLPEVRSRAEGPVSWHRRLRWDRALRDRKGSPLDAVLEGVSELDALVSLAEATVARDGWHLPKVLDGGPPRVEASALRHPALDDAVANDVALGGGARVLVLTGPNMAGKTTYLKACGIAVLLAHVGAAVPAETFRFSPLAGLHASFEPRGDLRRGVSSFRAEARRVSELLRASVRERRVLLLVDEPFRSTNVHDAREATDELIRGLAVGPELLAVVATHLGESAARMEGREGIALARMEAERDGDALRFPHLLRPGLTRQRLGLEVLEREGVFDLLRRLASSGGSPHDPPQEA